MRLWKLVTGVSVSLFFLYLTLFKPHLGSLYRGDEPIGQALFAETRFNGADLIRVLSGAQWQWIALTGALFFTTLFVRAWRWQLMLRPMVKMSFSHTFGAMCIGYMANNVLPFRMGELYRAFVVNQLSGLSRSAAFGSILLERLIDLLFMAPFIVAALLLFPLPGAIQQAAYVSAGAAVLLTAFCGWVVVDRARALGFAERILSVLPGKLANGLTKLMHQFTDGLAVLGKSETFLALSVSSLALWVMYSLMVFLVMKSVGLISPEFPQIMNNLVGATLVTLVMTTFGFVIPGAPGAVGTYHGVAVLGLSLFSVPGDRAVGFAIMLHALNYIPLTVLGLIFFWKNGLTFGGSRQLVEQFEHGSPPSPESGNGTRVKSVAKT